MVCYTPVLLAASLRFHALLVYQQYCQRLMWSFAVQLAIATPCGRCAGSLQLPGAHYKGLWYHMLQYLNMILAIISPCLHVVRFKSTPSGSIPSPDAGQRHRLHRHLGASDAGWGPSGPDQGSGGQFCMVRQLFLT